MGCRFRYLIWQASKQKTAQRQWNTCLTPTSKIISPAYDTTGLLNLFSLYKSCPNYLSAERLWLCIWDLICSRSEAYKWSVIGEVHKASNGSAVLVTPGMANCNRRRWIKKGGRKNQEVPSRISHLASPISHPTSCMDAMQLEDLNLDWRLRLVNLRWGGFVWNFGDAHSTPSKIYVGDRLDPRRN